MSIIFQISRPRAIFKIGFINIADENQIINQVFFRNCETPKY